MLTRHALFFLLLLAGINGFAQRPANGSLVQVQTNVTQNDPSLISFPHTGSSQLLLRKAIRCCLFPETRDFMDINMRFDKNTFVQTARKRALDKITERYWRKPDLTMAEAALKQAIDRYNTLKAELNSPDVLQKIVEEREKEYYRKIKTVVKLPDTATLIRETIETKGSRQLYKMAKTKNIITDAKTGTDSSYSLYLENRKKELDSLEQKAPVFCQHNC